MIRPCENRKECMLKYTYSRGPDSQKCFHTMMLSSKIVRSSCFRQFLIPPKRGCSFAFTRKVIPLKIWFIICKNILKFHAAVKILPKYTNLYTQWYMCENLGGSICLMFVSFTNGNVVKIGGRFIFLAHLITIVYLENHQ